MFKQVGKQLCHQTNRNFCPSKRNNFQITISGACGHIGQPVSLLLKQHKSIKQLNLYDIGGIPGVVADLSHIDTKNLVFGFQGNEQLRKSLEGTDIVVIAAGIPRRPGMTRADLFKLNADVIREAAEAIGDVCPKAMINIITNPVNSLVPVAAEILKKKGKYDPNRLFGVTTLDLVRARAFIGISENTDPPKVKIPVIGGHSGVTIIPVLSQSEPKYTKDIETMTKRIQEAGTEVLKAKAGAGTASLSAAHATLILVNSQIRGLKGKEAYEYAYVESNVTTAPFFANELCLGKNGIEKNLGLPQLNDYEKELLAKALPLLMKDINNGLDFASKIK